MVRNGETNRQTDGWTGRWMKKVTHIEVGAPPKKCLAVLAEISCWVDCKHTCLKP